MEDDTVWMLAHIHFPDPKLFKVWRIRGDSLSVNQEIICVLESSEFVAFSHDESADDNLLPGYDFLSHGLGLVALVRLLVESQLLEVDGLCALPLVLEVVFDLINASDVSLPESDLRTSTCKCKVLSDDGTSLILATFLEVDLDVDVCGVSTGFSAA